MVRVIRLVMAVGVAAMLGCQPLAGLSSAQLGESARSAGITADLPQIAPIRAADLTVRGQVEFGARAVQATSNDVIAAATVNMVDPSNSNTLGTSTTDAGGNFSLVPNQGITPQSGVYYLLDAVKGLGTNAPGKPTVRLRTLITWDSANGGWKSISNETSTAQGGTITIRSITTAVALVSSFDGSKVPASATIGKVVNSGGWKLANSAFEPGYSNSFVNALDSQIGKFLAADLDPVATINGLLPVISSVDTQSAAEGDTFVVNGTGFSPIPAENYLAWNTSQSLTGAALMNPVQASNTKLWFKLPQMASNGAGFAAVIMNNQLSNWQGLTIEKPVEAADSDAAPEIETIAPGNGKPGEIVTLKGKRFDAEARNVLIYFGSIRVSPITASETELTVRVPDSAKSDGVYIQTPTGQSGKVYFAVFADQQIAESFGNATYRDAAATTAVGWPGQIIEQMGSGDAGTGADGALTVTGGGTVVNTTRSYLATAASAGGNQLALASASGFSAGHEVMVIICRHPSSAGEVGKYEFRTISSVAGNTLTLTSSLSRAYNTNVTQVLRVPNYTTVVVNGGTSLVAPAWDGNTGGVLAFRANQSVTNNGTISANGTGYRGIWNSYSWWRTYPFFADFEVGEGRTNATSSRTRSANDFGGGGARSGYGPRVGWAWQGGAGGGGHATAGTAGGGGSCPRGVACSEGGRGGATGGATDETLLTFGGAGGANLWGQGGNGGGIVFMSSPTVTNNGAIQAMGNANNGAGGAGGETFIRSAYLNSPGSWNSGGSGPANSGINGTGGAGRNKIMYAVLDRAAASINASPAMSMAKTYDAFALLSVAQSKGYDTGNPRPFYTSYDSGKTLNGQTIAFQFSDSPDNSTWSAWTGDITTLGARFVRWKASLITTDPKVTPVLTAVTIKYKVAQ